MRSFLSAGVLFALTLSLGLVSCTSTQLRDVAASPSLNPERVRYLRQAAEAGVLFLISDNALRDLPTRQVGSCRKSEEAPWAENLFGILEGLDQNPRLYSKVHVIEVRRGDSATATIEKDSDGLTRLVISYAKRTNHEKISSLTELPCSNINPQDLNKDLEVTTFDWPTKEYTIGTLMGAEERPKLDEFNFDKKFLVYLADRLTILKVTQDQVYEKTPTGDYALTVLLNKLSADLNINSNLPQVDFWMKEIAMHSRQAASVEFFGFNKDFLMSYGVKVDSAGKFARRINNYSDPSYLYLSFKAESGSYIVPSLQDLNTCLEGLTTLYRSQDFVSTLDTDKDSYLYPGYHCRPK